MIDKIKGIKKEFIKDINLEQREKLILFDVIFEDKKLNEKDTFEIDFQEKDIIIKNDYL